MKKRFLQALCFALACFTGSACASNAEKLSEQNRLLGGWVANAQGKSVPAGASVFIGFWEGGNYTLATRYKNEESRIQGHFLHSGNLLVFDGNVRYKYRLDDAGKVLELTSAGGETVRYERVTMELLPANGAR